MNSIRPTQKAECNLGFMPSPVRSWRSADRWFRELGLPTFVPLRRWLTDLPRRVVPLMTVATIVVPAILDFNGSVVVEVFGSGGGEWLLLAVGLTLLAVIALLAWAGYRVVRAVLRRMPVVAGTIAAVLWIALCVAALIVAGYQRHPGAVFSPVVEGVAIMLSCMLITGAGGGAVFAWASRLAVRNGSAIGHMASIALPVILMLVVFAFFSAEVWQIGSALSWPSIALVAMVVAALALLVVLRVSAAEIDETRQTLTVEQRVALLESTPAAGRGADAVEPAPLRLAQRVNLLLVMAVAQLIQALLFAGLLWALLVTIGAITIPYGVIASWIGAATTTGAAQLRVEPVMLGGVSLPITINLIKTAAFLSIIAALPFVLSAVSEARYRERFFDPIMVDIRRAILVRDVLKGREI